MPTCPYWQVWVWGRASRDRDHPESQPQNGPLKTAPNPKASSYFSQELLIMWWFALPCTATAAAADA